MSNKQCAFFEKKKQKVAMAGEATAFPPPQ